MTEWLAQVSRMKSENGCLTLPEGKLAGPGRALALAPHPDDPDAIAITLRMLQEGGWTLYWTILTSGWAGVQDSFAGASREVKRRLREAEQRESAARFGLPGNRLTFLRLDEDDMGELAPREENRWLFFGHLAELVPDLVLLPHGNDTNGTHRLTFRWFTEWMRQWSRPVAALANEDPKTLGITPHLQIIFGETSAAWKASMLECHRSQTARNLAVRGITFSERILATNRRTDQHVENFEML